MAFVLLTADYTDDTDKKNGMTRESRLLTRVNEKSKANIEL
jgi:hypothetical protein